MNGVMMRGNENVRGIVLSFTTLQILQYCITCIGVLEIDAFVFTVSLKSKIRWSLWSIFTWKN